MFDLEQSLRQWRLEIEATLAFSSEEIDELEDHLRFSIDAKLKEGLTLESAWTRSLGGLGSASALSIEFAKDKLMPALWRLLVSWWKPACLMVLFGGIGSYSFSLGPMLTNAQTPVTVVRERAFWEITGLSLLITLILLPDKAQKNALLAGIGNAFCLIPLLHVLFYNAFTENFIGSGWSQMAASFGWPSISLSLVGLVFLNVWWWKRSAALGDGLSQMLAMAGTLVLILALSPFVGEWIGNLSIREIYHMPTASDVTVTGHTRDLFLNWKFIDVMVNSVMYVLNFLPFGLVLSISAGILFIRSLVPRQAMKTKSGDAVFPSLSALPWMMTMAASGLCWIAGHFFEAPFSENIRQVERSNFHLLTAYGGLEITVLFSAFLFFVCGHELTIKLAQASCIRPFYAAMLVVIEIGVAVALPLLPAMLEMGAIVPRQQPFSAQPEWLSWISEIAIVVMASFQIFLIAKKLRSQAGQISLWKSEGKSLVELGLLLGLIVAGSWLIFAMVTMVMAFESTAVVSAMMTWAQSIKHPANQFYPQMYGTPDHLAFWVASGITYLSFCLAAGLGSVITLSGLEFIRFNSYRLYKVRKAKQGLTETLVISE